MADAVPIGANRSEPGPPMKRHWSINGRFLTKPVTGVQRYAREILFALDALKGERHALTRDLELEVLALGPRRCRPSCDKAVHSPSPCCHRRQDRSPKG